ncbi:MAG TPA: hypothetical protein VKV28_02230 [Candidatus Binataceae bacterium]|nr:hypothetical protein [Candidatus Binataceae bacterium]
MELRLLETAPERAAFELALSRARATKGIGFCETSRSRLGQAHIAFADLYGIFEATASGPSRMVAGFAIHSLDTFPQSYAKPDLTHLPPDQVAEVGELWSSTLSGGMAARWGCTILSGLLQFRTVLIYPIVQPWDLTGAYPDFERAGEPTVWPFAQTLSGDKILVQPMLIQGDRLRRSIAAAWEVGFETSNCNRCVRFSNPVKATIDARRRVRRDRLQEMVFPPTMPLDAGVPAA